MKVSIAAVSILFLTAARAPAQSLEARNRIRAEADGIPQFGIYCRTCHGNAQVERAPDPTVLKSMPPERIYAALTTGVMQEQAKALTDAEKRSIAEYLAGRKLGVENGDARSMPNGCSGDASVRDLTSVASWNGWGLDLSNSRFQPAKAAGLSPGQVSRLTLKWAFGVPGASSVYGQPTVVDGKVFFSADSGYVYALDAVTGCVYWSFLAQAGVRSAISIGPAKTGSAKFAAYFADVKANVYAVNASNGQLLWKTLADKHPVARVSAAIKLYEGRLYVPVTALEESEAHDWRDDDAYRKNLPGGMNYRCCTSRGAVVALDAVTGEQIWKTYTIQEEPKPRRKTPSSREYWGPSGGGVWSSPTIDPVRRAVYVGTGNGFTLPAVSTTDAILALNMDTGRVLWSVQTTPNDVWHGGCLASRSDRPPTIAPGRANPPAPPPLSRDECPDDPHPDFDFSASPILTRMPDGKSILVAGQKSGVVYALDPENKGAILWQNEIARRMMGGGGEIVFGGAADSQTAYFPLHSGGLAAVQLADGVEKWYAAITPPAGNPEMARRRGITAAATVIPGVVFTVGLDGMIRAQGTNTGNLLWEYNTAKDFDTVNRVKAKGGTMGLPGVTIANGMAFVASGYIGFQNGAPGNVLLAFAPAY